MSCAKEDLEFAIAKAKTAKSAAARDAWQELALFIKVRGTRHGELVNFAESAA